MRAGGTVVATLEVTRRGPERERTGTTPTRRQPRLLDVGVAAGVGLLLVAFSTATYGVFWAPKATILLIGLVPGAVALLVLARARVPGARAALAFLAVAGVSTLLSDRPLLSLLGSHSWGTGWLFLVGLAGAWALGRVLSQRGVPLVEKAILAGVLANGAVAWVQIGVDLPVEALNASYGRAPGFLGNPVHVGAMCAGGMALVVGGLKGARRPAPWLAAAFVLAGAVELSGSRAGLVPLMLVAGWGLRYLGVRRGAMVASVVVLGALAAGALPRGDAASASGDQSATARAAISLSPGDSGRMEVWEASAEAFSARPVLGWGPGRTQTGISPRGEPQVAGYVDAHNWLLESAVTTGAVGLALLLTWLVGAGRPARGPLAVFAAAGAVVGLAQPLSVAVTPVLLLALGAAVPARAPVDPFAGQRARRATVTGIAVAVVAGSVFLAGEHALGRAAVDFSPGALARAERLLPGWPVVGSVGWRVHAFDAIDSRDEAGWDRALAYARQAVDADPADSDAWATLADLHLRLGHRREAARAYDEALARHPWNRRALNGAVYFAHQRGDDDAVEELCERRSRVVTRPSACPGAVVRMYDPAQS